jgi:hypothetical protein
MLSAVLEQELPTLAENLRLEQEQVDGPPQRPLVAEHEQAHQHLSWLAWKHPLTTPSLFPRVPA